MYFNISNYLFNGVTLSKAPRYFSKLTKKITNKTKVFNARNIDIVHFI